MTRLLAIIEATTITGPARNLLEFARHSEPEGIETVVATFVRGAPDNLFLRTARAQGTRIETVEESGPFDSAVPARLHALLDRVRPDVLQTHAVKSHFLARRAGLHKRVPWVAFHHGYTWPTLKARLYNQFDRWSLRAPQRILTVSLPFRDELAAMGICPARIEVIHNAIEPDWTSHDATLRASLGIPEGRNIVLIVGRLSREKDHLSLLAAIAQLSRELNPHLVILGEGPERPRIEAAIAALNMSDRTTLAGQRDSAKPFYGIAAVAVLSSLTEGSPNALLEAMSAGVPSVATRVGGVPEIVDDGQSALLVAPSNIPQMRDAIARILSDPPFAASLVANARQRIAQHHRPQVRAARLAALYHQLAGENLA